jgi:hypothetical protein
LIQLIETFSDTRIGLLRAARLTPVMDEKITEDERKRSGARSGSDFCGAKLVEFAIQVKAATKEGTTWKSIKAERSRLSS